MTDGWRQQDVQGAPVGPGPWGKEHMCAHTQRFRCEKQAWYRL